MKKMKVWFEIVTVGFILLMTFSLSEASGGADLSITKMQMIPETFASSEQASLEIEITNIGNATAQQLYILCFSGDKDAYNAFQAFQIEGCTKPEFTLGLLKANQSRKYTFKKISKLSPGTYKIIAVIMRPIDKGLPEQYVDLNPINNRKQLTFKVKEDPIYKEKKEIKKIPKGSEAGPGKPTQ